MGGEQRVMEHMRHKADTGVPGKQRPTRVRTSGCGSEWTWQIKRTYVCKCSAWWGALHHRLTRNLAFKKLILAWRVPPRLKCLPWNHEDRSYDHQHLEIAGCGTHRHQEHWGERRSQRTQGSARQPFYLEWCPAGSVRGTVSKRKTEAWGNGHRHVTLEGRDEMHRSNCLTRCALSDSFGFDWKSFYWG